MRSVLASSLLPEQVLLDYVDSNGPRVTHTRGILIAGSRAGLQSLGLFEQYAALLPPLHKDALLYCVANSWLPMDETLAHFEACDRLELTRSHYETIGKALAERMATTFLGAALRYVRSLGVEGQLVWSLSKMDRFMKRIYTGGRCTIVQRGPKDVTFELSGIPFARSSYYRNVVLVETKTLMSMLCKSLFAKLVPARAGSEESLALSLSWV
jgi:hypothetical protein